MVTHKTQRRIKMFLANWLAHFPLFIGSRLNKPYNSVSPTDLSGRSVFFNLDAPFEDLRIQQAGFLTGRGFAFILLMKLDEVALGGDFSAVVSVVMSGHIDCP